MIPYGRQDINADDIQAVIAALQSDWLTQGPAVPEFEATVAARCGAQHAVATCNATAALHIACRALDLQAGDRLWTSPNTFVASANCALYCGASVDFVDIDPRTFNMCAVALKTKLENAERDNCLPKIVVPVHFGGQSCDMRTIRALADRYGFRVIEDASHAVGATYLDRPVGSCQHADIAVFSFHPVKIVTTAEGGMALTNNAELAGRLQRLRSHGITRDAHLMDNADEGPWYYEQLELGFNYRMTDLQAALGTSQLRRLDAFIARRRALAARYDRLLASLPVQPQAPLEGAASSWHLYVVRVKSGKYGHRSLFEELRAADIGVNLHYIPVYRQPYYARMGYNRADFPNAEAYYQEAISLPMYPGLTDEMQDKVISTLHKLLG